MNRQQGSANGNDNAQLRQLFLELFKFLLITIGLLLLVYVLWFGVIHPRPVSADPEQWGQLGDYIGGILNPFIALFALALLAHNIQIQQKTLLVTQTELQESRALLRRQQFESQFSNLMAMLAEHKRGNADHIRASAKRIQVQYANQKDNDVRNEFDNIGYVLHPLMSLIRTLLQAIKDHDLSTQERSGYLDIIRSQLTTDDGILILLGPYVNRLPDSDKELVYTYGLLDYMDPRVRSDIQSSMSNRLQNPLAGK